jgi:ribosomal protein S18 acetylase RimI-like enzyme
MCCGDPAARGRRLLAVSFRSMTADLEVRIYRTDDEAAVVALWNDGFPNAGPWNEPRFVIAKKLAMQSDLFFVAVEDRAIVGTAMGGYDGHRGWLYTVAVRSDLRRRGIGSALVRQVETSLAALGCPKLNLQVRATNAAVIAFYERLGYEVEERVSMGKRLGS